MELKPKVLAGNWKMNTTVQEGMDLTEQIIKGVNHTVADPHVRIIVGVPFTHIVGVVEKVDYNKISVAAQNCSSEKSGAFTGEISAEMIKSTGAHYVIIGHSERRSIFGEDYSVLKKKVDITLANELRPIFCVGENLEQRKSNSHKDVVKEQLESSFLHIDKENLKRSIVAYEPVWAIGTGETASPEQAQEMHAFIRSLIASKYPDVDADSIPILYGGSVKPNNAEELFNQKDINGGLVGGASLKSDSFIDILKAFKS